jgi:APA family basic amino acid/polyamine antiporter
MHTVDTTRQSAPPGSSSAVQPARVLGGLDAGCVVIGAIIGVGIFFTPSRVAELTQTAPLALMAWAIAGGIALCGALTFAALGRKFHASGAQYEILRDSYGPLPGFVFVFCNATAIQPGAIAIISIICAKHLGMAATGREPTGPALIGLSAGLIAALVAANLVGVRWGSRIQNLTVFAKLATLLAVTAAAVFFAPSQGSTPPTTVPDMPASGVPVGFTGVLAALVACFFSYGGWQHALWISGEVREPRRNLPRAIVGGVLLVVIVYLLANWAYLRLLGAEGVAQSGALAADAAKVVMPGRWRCRHSVCSTRSSWPGRGCFMAWPATGGSFRSSHG